MKSEDMSTEGMTEEIEPVDKTVAVPQWRLDQWRAYAEQTRKDMFALRQLVAAGQGDAAQTLAGSVLDQTLHVAHSLDEAGANRPAGMPTRPTGEDRLAAQTEAEE